jgi:inorganic triphosphatase YgiF
MEIELKYKIARALDATAVEQLDASPYHLLPGKDEQHHDEVLDTPTRSLTGKRLALRLRRSAGTVTVTYKGPDTVSDGLHQREELEATFAADSLPRDYRDWSPEIAEQIEPSIGSAPLAPLVEMDVHRITWNIRRESHVIAELALDEGSIRAGGKTSPIHELEIELKGEGTRDDLDALDQLFSRQLPIQPESQSKLQRGLALLQE